MKVTLLALLLFSSPFVFAQHQLGSIRPSSITCPSSGLKGGECFALQISCPEIPDYTAYVKILNPQRAIGTVILTTGGNGTNLYEQYQYGTVTVQDLVSARYRTVELTFGAPFSNGPGWQHDVNGKGIVAASCRYASVVQWVYEVTAGQTLCATGNSAGGEVIGEGLAHYGLGNYLTFAELTSGPPFSRVDYACIDDIPPAVEYCSGAFVGMGVGITNAQNFIDPAYPSPLCSYSTQTHSTTYEQTFLDDSITSPDAILSYPNTRVRFLFGGLDNTTAIREGLNYQSHIAQPSSFACVPDAPHSIPNVLDGAQTIAQDLINNCRGFRQ